MALGFLVIAGVVYGIAWWTGTWWSLLVIPAGIGIVAGLTRLMPEKSRGYMGCLFAVLMLVALTYLFPAWKKAGDAFTNGPADKSYTQDAFLRCKDILYGSGYPEDRLTQSEREMVIKCAQG